MTDDTYIKLFLGGILSFFTIILLIGVYDGYLLVIAGHELSDTVLVPKLFMCFFTVIGIPLFLSGLKDLYDFIKIEKKGKEICGVLIDYKPTGSYYDSKPYYYALVLLKDDISNFVVLKYNIGLDKDKYPIGTYLKVKYYKNKIKIMGQLYDENLVPLDLAEYLSLNYPNINNPNVILFNGEYYERED